MASDRDKWADSLSADHSGGWLTGFLAEEDEFDRRSLWRLGSWGVGAVAAVIIALYANQSTLGVRQDQLAASDLMRQSQQIQWVAKESQNESRRLASAIDTLNTDRDRLYSRVSGLEQGLDSVTGSIARQSAAAASAPTSPAPPDTSAVFQTGAPPSLVVPPSTAASGAAPAAASQNTASQNMTPPVAAPATVAAATTTAPATDKATDKPPIDKTGPDKPATVAALQPDKSQAAAAPNSSTVAPAASATPQEPTNKASAAAIIAPALPTTAPLMPAKSIMAPPDPAASKLTEPEPAANTVPALPPPQTVANAPSMTEPPDAAAPAPALPTIALQRTEFGVDLGGANSVDGLRALWRGLLKYRANKALSELRPIIVVKERSNGLGMQLRLVAGPLNDAAAAAKLCATLTENDRSCETTVFDGQRLAVNGDSSAKSDKNEKTDKSDANAKSDNSAPAPVAAPSNHRAPAATRSSRRRGNASKGAKVEEPAPKDAAKPVSRSLTSFLGLR
jgi:hypothetical protein